MDQLKPCSFRQVDNHGRILCGVIKGGDREVSVKLCSICPVSQINCQNLRAGLEKKVSTPITVRFATGRVEVWDDMPPTIEFKQAACAAKTMPIHSPRDCAGCPIRVPNVVPTSAIQVAHRNKQNAAAVAPVAAVPSAQPQRAPRTTTHRSPVVPQPVAHAAPFVMAQSQVQSQPASVDVGAANDLIARAKAMAARKAEEKQQRELERIAREQQEQYQATHAQAKPKIIQMKEWLAEQMNKKSGGDSTRHGKGMNLPQAVRTDEDGVSDIVYAPLGMQMANGYQETIDYERCVGWTD
jgi:hypothetical protein